MSFENSTVFDEWHLWSLRMRGSVKTLKQCWQIRTFLQTALKSILNGFCARSISMSIFTEFFQKLNFFEISDQNSRKNWDLFTILSFWNRTFRSARNSKQKKWIGIQIFGQSWTHSTSLSDYFVDISSKWFDLSNEVFKNMQFDVKRIHFFKRITCINFTKFRLVLISITFYFVYKQWNIYWSKNSEDFIDFSYIFTNELCVISIRNQYYILEFSNSIDKFKMEVSQRESYSTEKLKHLFVISGTCSRFVFLSRSILWNSSNWQSFRQTNNRRIQNERSIRQTRRIIT